MISHAESAPREVSRFWPWLLATGRQRPTSSWFPRCRVSIRGIRLHLPPYYTSAYYAVVTNRRTHASQLIDAMTIAQNEIVATPIDGISTALAEFAIIWTTYGRS